MARAAGLAVSTVQKIWKVHGLAPHRWRQFKLSNDPAFAEKLNDVVGLAQPTVSHHLKVLVDAGILAREKRGVWAWYRVVPGALGALGGLLREDQP